MKYLVKDSDNKFFVYETISSKSVMRVGCNFSIGNGFVTVVQVGLNYL